LERKVRDSCGISGTGETPKDTKCRGGSPHAPRKASNLERKSTSSISNNVYKQPLFFRKVHILLIRRDVIMAKRKHALDAAAKNNQTPTESMTNVEFSDEKFADEIPKRDTQSPRSKGK
jgi:hypothetical protein